MHEKIKEQMLHVAKAMRNLNHTAKVSGERFDIPLSDREINIVYYRADKEKAPLLLGFHGGGFLFGGNALNDAMWSAVRDALGVNVASVEYRKSPDCRSMDAILDGYEAAHYFKAHADQYGFDENQISVMGCSAGANLAAGICIYAASKGEHLFTNQVLIYPLVDNVTDPTEKNGGEPADPGDYIFRELACTAKQAKTPVISPILASEKELNGLPNTIITVAEHDYLKNEGLRYAEHLKQADVPVAVMESAGMPHIFFEVGFGTIPEAEKKSYSPMLQDLIDSGKAHEASVKVLEFAAKNYK